MEFARVFGFEVDFQRDIRKGDSLKFYTKNLKMIMEKLNYASMYVNREINLYNLK